MRIMKGFLGFVFALFLSTVVAESLQPVDKLLSGRYPINGGCGYGSFPLDEQLQCQDLDELGGQPIITAEVSQGVRSWAEKNFPPTPRYYLSKVPKRGLAQDVLTKQRQDRVLQRLNRLRSAIIDAYCQCVVLNIETSDFDEMKKKYSVIISSRCWKELGARDSAKSLNAGEWLLDKISKKGVEDVKRVYAKVLIAKKARYQHFAAEHPETAQTTAAIQRAKQAELRAKIAEAEALNARQAAVSASATASAAQREAEEANRRAKEANRRAADAQLLLDTGVW